MPQIALLAVNGCLASSISNLIDTFTIANLWHKALAGTSEELFATSIVAEKREPVNCNGCIELRPHHSLSDEFNPDYLIIPALLPIPEPQALRRPAILDYIRRCHRGTTTIASVCTGAFLLAESGLLDGRRATTNWQFEKKFRYRYPRVRLEITERLTEDGNILCSGATSSIMHLALAIIGRENVPQLVSACAKAMLVDPNSLSQAPYPIRPLTEPHGDMAVQKAERYLRDHLSVPITIDQVAEHVCLSPRHFKRRFRKATGEPPLSYLQQLRIQAAKNRLENSLDSIEEITRQVGYEDSSTFRRLFKRHTSLSPRAYRDRFLLHRNG